MPQENVEIVRQPLTVAPHSRRRLEERLGLRFPGVLALVDRLVWRLPPLSAAAGGIRSRGTAGSRGA